MRRRTFIATAATTVASVGLAGCGFLGGGSPERPIRDAADALESNDPEAFRATYHPDSPDRPEGDATFDLVTYEEVTIERIEVLEEDGDEAVVEAELSFTAEFMGQTESDTSTTRFEVRQHEGEWRIWSAEDV